MSEEYPIASINGQLVAEVKYWKAKAEAWEQDALRYAQNVDHWKDKLVGEQQDHIVSQNHIYNLEREIKYLREQLAANEKDTNS